MDTLQKILDMKYSNFGKEEKEQLYALLETPGVKQELKDAVESWIYIKKPPTPEEFLDWRNGWIAKATEENMFDWIKSDFCEIINNSHKYNIISFYGATRTGKSHLTRLIIYYTQVFINHLRDPQLFFGVSPDTNLAQYLICFNYNKTKQLLLDPIYQLLSKSQRVVKVTFKDQVIKKQLELGPEYFVYSTAATTGALTTSKNFQLQLGNASPLSLIGSDILQTYVTEIAYFIEKEGASEEEIFQLYSDSVDRIKATMGKSKHLAFTLLDSSANIADSRIEKHILEDLSQADDVFYRRLSRWEVIEYHTKLYPSWKETKETFPVCTGNSTFPSKIIEHKKEIGETPKNLVIHVPIDALPEFKRNLPKSIKDIAGFPASNENKLILDPTLITDLFNEDIINIEGVLIADSMDKPEKLIWDQVYPKLFTQYKNNKYMIKRAHQEPRYIGIDFAFSLKGDVAGIACVHRERDFENSVFMYIVDFAFTIMPGTNEINFAAIEHFVKDLSAYGNLPIRKVSSDSFQNKQFEQDLNRIGITTYTSSVDRTLDPYLHLMTALFNREIKSGKNIFLKNNLDSLIRSRRKSGSEKIDHSEGQTNNKYYGNWKESTCGIHAKDCSDAVTSAIFSCYQDNLIPGTDYNREQQKLSKKIEDKQVLIKDAYSILHKTM